MTTRLRGKGRQVKIDVRVLITEKDGVYNATCLEMGLATAGPDLDTVIRDMAEVIVAHIGACEEEGHPEDAFVPAPAEYWRTYVEAVAKGTCRTRRIAPPPEHRQVSESFLSHLAMTSYVCAAG